MFFRKRNTELIRADYGFLNADMHSHLLPDIDDGSPDLETSLMLIKGLKDLGFKKLITTPHVMWDMYQNTGPIVMQKLAELRKKLHEEEIDIEINAAAEYFIDEHLGEMLERKEPLLTFGNRMVLVEFSMASPPIEWKKNLFEMQLQGYQPVIAHPERYVYLDRSREFYDQLKHAGYLFQLNILSLGGIYGNAATELARHLIKQQYYDLIGTDLHHFRHLTALNNSALPALLQRVLESGKIQNPQL